MRQTTTIIALLFLFIAATGIAAANPADMDITPSTIVITPDNTTVTHITATTSLIDYTTFGSPHDRYISVETDDPNLCARIVNNSVGVDTGWGCGVRVDDTYSAVNPNDYVWDLQVKGDWASGVRHVTVHDNAGTTYNATPAQDTAEATRNTLIPEFPTIALPIAAILGLVFLFNRRKRAQ